MEEGTEEDEVEEEEDEVEEEEDEGKGADLRWLRGGAAGGYLSGNGMANGWSFFFFFAYFLYSSPLCFCFLLLFLEVLLSTRRTMAAGGC